MKFVFPLQTAHKLGTEQQSQQNSLLSRLICQDLVFRRRGEVFSTVYSRGPRFYSLPGEEMG